MQDYRVQLDTYSGPMDLLLYLIRREEVDIYDIPISRVLEQYLSYVRLLEAMDPDGVGEFLVLAATLMEIKSRMLLPKAPPEEADDDDLDPRADLVRQLLAYRAFREAAIDLKDRADEHSMRFARPRTDLPDDEQEVELEDVQIWDLLSAFNRLMASVGVKPGAHEVFYDDTPISLHAADIQDRLQRDGPSMRFEAIFEGRTRSEMVGLFLALLELIRQKRIRIDQPVQFAPIVVHLIDPTPITEILEDIEPDQADASDGMDVDPAEDVDEEAPLEEVDEAEQREAVFADDEDDFDDEDDEFSRRIDSVQISEVDLGRTIRGLDDTESDAGAGSPGEPSDETAFEEDDDEA